MDSLRIKELVEIAMNEVIIVILNVVCRKKYLYKKYSLGMILQKR